MEKEFNELLKELDNIIDNFNHTNISTKEIFDKMVNEEMQKPCKIVINKKEKEDVHLGIEGSRLTLLLVLAGAEKTILNQLECNEKEFNYIKSIVGTISMD